MDDLGDFVGDWFKPRARFEFQEKVNDVKSELNRTIEEQTGHIVPVGLIMLFPYKKTEVHAQMVDHVYGQVSGAARLIREQAGGR